MLRDKDFSWVISRKLPPGWMKSLRMLLKAAWLRTYVTYSIVTDAVGGRNRPRPANNLGRTLLGFAVTFKILWNWLMDWWVSWLAGWLMEWIRFTYTNFSQKKKLVTEKTSTHRVSRDSPLGNWISILSALILAATQRSRWSYPHFTYKESRAWRYRAIFFKATQPASNPVIKSLL